MARAAVIPQPSPSPKRGSTRGRKGARGAIGTASATNRNLMDKKEEQSSTTGGNTMTDGKTRGRTTKTQALTGGTTESNTKKRTTRSKASNKNGNNAVLDGEGAGASDDDDDEIELISSKAQSNSSRRGKAPASSSSKPTGRGKRNVTSTSTGAATDAEDDDDELAQTDTAPQKKQVGRPRAKKSSSSVKDSGTSATVISDTGSKQSRGRPKAAATKLTGIAAEESRKGVTTRKKTRAQTASNTNTNIEPLSEEETDPKQVGIGTGSSTAGRSNMLRGPAKKKKVTFQDVSDSEKEIMALSESAPGWRRKTKSTSASASTSTRRSGLNAKAARSTAASPGSGRGRKPTASTANKEAPKPLSPKKATQVAKSLSSYASSDSEVDELIGGKDQDQNPAKLVVKSPTKHGSENNTGLSSPVKRINLKQPNENDVFVHPTATRSVSGNSSGLSSPVRKINFTPNKLPYRHVDENSEHGTKQMEFKNSASFMSSPAKRPASSPFQYKIKEPPKICPLAVNDLSKSISSQPSDFTPKRSSPLKSSPRRADLSASLSHTPLNSFSSSTPTPLFARTRLFQSPAKKFPSPFKGSGSPRRASGSMSVGKDGDLDLNSSVCCAGPEESSRKTESREKADRVVIDDTRMVESQHDADAEFCSEPENEVGVRSEIPIEEEAAEENKVPKTAPEQETNEENDLDVMELNERDPGYVQEQVEQETPEDAVEDPHVHSAIYDGQNGTQEQSKEGAGPTEDTQIPLDIDDAQGQRDFQEQGQEEEPLRLSDGEEDVQVDSEVEEVQQVFEDQHIRDSVHDSNDVFVEDPVNKMAETPEMPAGKRPQEYSSGSHNESNDENGAFSDVGDFDFDDDPTLVASTENERYMPTPRRLFPYEISENEYDGTSPTQRIHNIPPPAPSPPASSVTRPFSFRYRQESGGNVESDIEEFGPDAGSAMEERPNSQKWRGRSGSRTSSGRRVKTPPRERGFMEEQCQTLHGESPRFTPLAQRFSQWDAGSPEKAQSRHPRRRGVFSLSGNLRPIGESSRRSSRPSRVSAHIPRRSMTGEQSSPLRELPVQEVTFADPASEVQKPEMIRNDSSFGEQGIFSDVGTAERAETQDELFKELHTQQAAAVFDDSRPASTHSTNRVEIYCDENEAPVTQNDEPVYPDLSAAEDEYDKNKENENRPATLSAKSHVSAYPDLVPETGDSNENKEDYGNGPVSDTVPVTPSKNRNNDSLHVSHTVSKVPLKPEGQVSPLKTSRKRGRSLSNASPSRSSPRLRNRVLFPPKNSMKPTYSPPRKSMKLQEPERTSEVIETECAQDENNEDPYTVVNSPTKSPRRNINEDRQVLRGAVVFVDVHTTEGEDASGIFIELLQQMGAKCVRTWAWNPRQSHSPVDESVDSKDNKVGITHIVYKDGGVRTLEKVRQAGGLVKCVGVGWVLDCERENKWLDETDYTVDSSIIPRGGAKRRKSMEPLTLSNVNGTLVKKSARGRQSGSDSTRFSPSTTSQDEPGTPEIHHQSDGDHDDVEYGNNTPRAFPTTPRGKDYDFSRLDDIGMSPATPFFLSSSVQRSKLVQQTCPPKQTRQGLFEDYYRMKGEGEASDNGDGILSGDGAPHTGQRLRDRLEAVRRKSLAFKPKVGSPLAL